MNNHDAHVRSEGRWKGSVADGKGKGICKRDRDQGSMHEEQRDEGRVIKHVDISVHNRDQVGKTSNPERTLACRDQVEKTSNQERALACDIGMVSVSIDNDEQQQQQQQQNTHNAPTSPITQDNPVSARLELFENLLKHR